MNQDPLRELKAKIYRKKQLISEVHQNVSKTIAISINGHFEITKLIIQPNVAHKTIEEELPCLITDGIKSVSEKINQVLMEFQAANS
jgi:DNA-binding protein YbaB